MRAFKRLQYFKRIELSPVTRQWREGARERLGFHGGDRLGKDVGTVFYAINEVGKDKYNNYDLDR